MRKVLFRKVFILKFLLCITCFISSCERTAEFSTNQASNPTADEANQRLDELTAGVWDFLLETDHLLRIEAGLPVERLSDITLEQSRKNAVRAAEFLALFNDITTSQLSHDRYLTHGFVIRLLERIKDGPQTYPYSFAVTPYSGGYMFAPVIQYMQAFEFKNVDDLESYKLLLRELASLARQAREKTLYQADLGIFLPRPAIPNAILLFEGLRDNSQYVLSPSLDRLQFLTKQKRAQYVSEVHSIIRDDVIKSYDSLLAVFDVAYQSQASDKVGLSNFPNGKSAYRKAIKQYTSYDLDPAFIHEYGKGRMAEIQEEMHKTRQEIGFDGTQAEFHAYLKNNPRFIAKTPSEVEARYLEYIARIEPIVDDYFTLAPKTPYGVMRLQPENEAGQTFGYYQRATSDNQIGLYRYNGSNLENRSMIVAGPLIYHELIPGHHFHMALQQENPDLPPVRKNSISINYSAFNEGWGEYAAGLGYEMGLYEDPYDRYGRLVMDAFLISRLVVDTGLNELGWSLEEARAYMLENTMQSELEIASETLRYSTDIPGQALSYKIGHKVISDARAFAEAALGDKFDIKEFHTVILEAGVLPLDLLEENVDWYIARVAAK